MYDTEKKTWYAEVGSIVYQAYKPQNPGVVISVEKESKTWPNGYVDEYYVATIHWIKGQKSKVRCINLQNFDGLIADHEKKLQTHKKAKEKLLNIIEKEGL